jgi:hypothetical protein
MHAVNGCVLAMRGNACIHQLKRLPTESLSSSLPNSMARDISKVLIKIEDEQQWESILELSEGKLVVVDCHQEWCGCCEAIHPTINRVLLDYDNIEERFVYSSASIGKLDAIICTMIH